jgi:hypothetical protein
VIGGSGDVSVAGRKTVLGIPPFVWKSTFGLSLRVEKDQLCVITVVGSGPDHPLGCCWL